jgi:hypothetical protein
MVEHSTGRMGSCMAAATVVAVAAAATAALAAAAAGGRLMPQHPVLPTLLQLCAF